MLKKPKKKWIVLGIAVASLTVFLITFKGELKGNFNPDNFKRYDLIITDSVLHQMDSLAKPNHQDYTGSKAWFKAKILVKGDTLKTKIRLKGDKADHYDSKLLSWRLKYKLKGKKQVISLQHPKTRKYLAEWIYHQLLKQEALNYLEFNYVSVYVNNKFRGLYAEEEHFSNHDIEEKWNRTHGPILKYDDENFWPEGQYKTQAEFGTNAYFEAEIKCFNYTKKERKTDHYKKSVALLTGYRAGEIPADQVFDLKLLGQFYALADLVGGYHSLRWINSRYYYNTSTELFEPVGFDSDSRPIGKLVVQQKGLNPAHHSKIMNHPTFIKHYETYLKKYSKKRFLDDFLSRNDKELNVFLEAFQDQFNVDKRYITTDMYLNQWVITFRSMFR
jgi:spore coat protein CotH